MAINFKLKEVWRLDPDEDDMGRTWVGWDANRTPSENFDHNRGLWHLGKRAKDEQFATFSLNGEVCLVAEMDGVETIPSKSHLRRPKSAVVGHVLEPGHPAYELLIGRQVDAHRNPMTYLSDLDDK